MSCVLITGGGRGLGLEFTRQYRRDGWRVLVTVRDAVHADNLRHLGAEVHILDMSDIPAIVDLAEKLKEETIDVLIANAGINPSQTMRLDNPDGLVWERTFKINTIGPLALAGAFSHQVQRSQHRKMIAISSRLGSIAANENGGLYIYRTSKAALNAGWRSIAMDNPELIATVLSPGWVRTDMGGSNAPLSAEDSISGMRHVITGLSKAQSGGFLDYTGTALPW